MEAAQRIENQDIQQRDDLNRVINDIVASGHLQEGDCPVTEIDPDYERDAIHRSIGIDNILSAVLENEEEEEKNTEVVEIESPQIQETQAEKKRYTSREKLVILSELMDFIDDEQGCDLELF